MKKLLILFLFANSINYCITQTIEFSGPIENDTEWDYDTVRITGDVTIGSGKTLTVKAGILIEFQEYYKISSTGRLLFLGTPEEKITLTINDTTGYSSNRSNVGWGGLKMTYNWDGGSYGNSNENDSTIFENCIFEYSRSGAIFIENFSKVRISYCTISRNYGSSGSGIELDYSNALIDNCSFFENYSYNDGGAISLWSAGPVIRNSSFINNHGWQGGAINITGDDAKIINNIFCYNSTYNGGAFKFHGFDGVIGNNIICNNTAVYGGGAIYGGSGNVIFVNNTICNNKSNYAPGIYVSDNYYIINSIFWGNGNAEYHTEQIRISNSGDNPTVQNCLVEDAEDYDLSLFSEFTNVLSVYPSFIDSSNVLTYMKDTIISNWSFDSTSICVNQGINDYYNSTIIDLQTDILGNKRISNIITDIGAFEYQFQEANYISYIENSGVSVYPNPTSNRIRISYNSDQILTIELYGLSGNQIISENFQSKKEIDLSKYKPGLYYLIIKDNGMIKDIKKIVKE